MPLINFLEHFFDLFGVFSFNRLFPLFELGFKFLDFDINLVFFGNGVQVDELGSSAQVAVAVDAGEQRLLEQG